MSLHVTGIRVWFLPVRTRVPCQIGAEVLTEMTCARVAMTVRNERGDTGIGWGESPLNFCRAWPSPNLSHQQRDALMQRFCLFIARCWAGCEGPDAFDLGHTILERYLPQWIQKFDTSGVSAMPRLATLVCNSAFDFALYDAAGNLANVSSFGLLTPRFMTRTLDAYLTCDDGKPTLVAGRHPAGFLAPKAPKTIPAWHTVGVKDPVDETDLTGSEPEDDHPVMLRQWIAQDGLKCLKVRLSGSDWLADYARMERIARIGLVRNVRWLCCGFDRAVREPAYVSEMLDRFRRDQPEIFDSILYIEQPFAREFDKHLVNVGEVARRKPIYLDDTADDWRAVRRGLELGWTGVALKSSATLTSALLSLCWARAHGMGIMFQDMNTAMLGQISHVLLAAHARPLMGAESTNMQYYCPQASLPEARIHPGMFHRTKGRLDRTSALGPGFGYRVQEIARVLPEPAIVVGDV